MTKKSLGILFLITIAALLVSNLFEIDKNRKLFEWITNSKGKVYFADKELIEGVPKEIQSYSRDVFGYREVAVAFEFPPEDISNLRKVPNLSGLSIDNPPTSGGVLDVSGLEGLNLRRFVCYSTISDTSFLARMTKLQYLSLHKNSFDLSLLKNLKELELFSISDNRTLNDIKYQNLESLSLPKLRVLSFKNLKLKDLESITHFKGLTHLTLQDCVIDDFTHLGELKHLWELRFLSNEIAGSVVFILRKIIKSSPDIRLILSLDDLDAEDIEQLSALDAEYIGDFFDQSELPQKDLAYLFYLSAASKGSKRAMEQLGLYFYKGQGASKDINQSLEWYQKAYRSGSEKAKAKLGLYYLHGIDGINQNVELGLKYLSEAVESGNVNIAEYLVKLYLKGINEEGFKPDKVKAHFWYKKYLELGGPEIVHKDLIIP